MLWFEFLGGFFTIVDQAETGRSSSSEGSPESEKGDATSLRFVHFRETFLHLGSGNIWLSWVDHIDDHLTSLKEDVPDEFSCADGDGVAHDWIRGIL